MKKNISILIYSLAAGGAERVVSILLKELSIKYNITLFLMNNTIFYDIPKSIKIIYLEKSNPDESGVKKFLKLPVLGWKYRKFIKKYNVFISLSFMNRPNYINVFAKLFGSRSKTIISERIAPFGEYGGLSFKDRINRLLIKFLYPKADIIIPNSKLTGFELNRFFNVLEEKIKIIYNPIDLKKIENLKNKDIIIKKEKFTFVTVGRFERQKNHMLLIDAFYKLNLDIEIWLIGDGHLRKKIEEKISNLKLKEKIKLLGKQKNPYKFLAKADCFIFSSNYEGFPNVLLEALACNLPVISTDCISGPREILVPNSDFKKQTEDVEVVEYGVLVPVGDVDKMAQAMRMMIENDSLRKKLREKAYKRAKDFEVSKIIKEWEEVLSK